MKYSIYNMRLISLELFGIHWATGIIFLLSLPTPVLCLTMCIQDFIWASQCSSWFEYYPSKNRFERALEPFFWDEEKIICINFGISAKKLAKRKIATARVKHEEALSTFSQTFLSFSRQLRNGFHAYYVDVCNFAAVTKIFFHGHKYLPAPDRMIYQ